MSYRQVAEAPAVRVPLLLFTDDPLSMQDAYGADLGEATTNQIKLVLTEPTIFDVIEGQRVLQVGHLSRV